MTSRLLPALLLSSTCLMALPQAAFAQGTASLEEIVVTARQREETLLEAPITVQVMTAEQIARNPSSGIREIVDMLPNVTAGAVQAGSMGSFNIRGIGGANSSDVGVDQAVLMVIDNLPISRGTGVGGALFDLANVQSLPGPQALYFGKNASGGVISFTTANPTKELEVFGKVGYEFDARQRYLEAVLSGPVSSQLGARLAFRYDESEGWLKNLAGPMVNPYESDPLLKLQPGARDRRLGGAKNIAARLTLDYEPTSNFKATLKAQISDSKTDNMGQVFENFLCSPGFTQPHAFAVIDIYNDCTINGKTSMGDMNTLLAQYFPRSNGGANYSKSVSKLGSLKLDYDAGAFSITSVTGYYDAKIRGLGNFTWASINYFPGANSARDEQISQELRVNTKFDGALNFIVGGYIDHQKRYGDTVGRGLIPNFLPPINNSTLVPGAEDILPTAIGYWPQHRGKTDTYSVFGQITWNITDQLQFDGGARYTKVKGNQNSRNAYLAPFYASLFAGAATGAPCNSLGLPQAAACLFVPADQLVRFSFSEDNVSPEATLSWRPNDRTTVYVSYKTGYKPGGISGPSIFLQSNLSQDLTYSREKSEGGEVGVKTQMLDSRLFLSATAYYYKFSGLQLNQFDSATTSFFIRNAGSAVTKGFELQANWEATPELQFNALLTYNDAYFSDYNNAACYNGQTFAQGCNVPTPTPGRFVRDLTGTRLNNAPKITIISGFTWQKPLSNGMKFGIDGDLKYSSKYRLGTNVSDRAVQGSFIKLNARIRLSGQDDHWQAAVIGRNLTNKLVAYSAFAKPGTNNAFDGFSEELAATVLQGRQLGLEFTVRY
jgi:outer membrane receptor protein involved in Fe transport